MDEVFQRNELIEEFQALPFRLGIPARRHPWFEGLISGEKTKEQIRLGELQHTQRGWFLERLTKDILGKALTEGDADVTEAARANYEEEAGGSKPHGDLMFQFHEELGFTKAQVKAVELMPGTLACMAMLGEGVRRFNALGSLAMMTLAEWQNASISAEVYPALQKRGEFSDYAIETYAVHAIADIEHGDNQFELLARKIEADPSQKSYLLNCMVYGARAFNYNWDGQEAAATNNPFYAWRGLQ